MKPACQSNFNKLIEFNFNEYNDNAIENISEDDNKSWKSFFIDMNYDILNESFLSKNFQDKKEIETIKKEELFEIKGNIIKNDKKETNINTGEVNKTQNEIKDNSKYKEISINKKRSRNSNTKTNNNRKYEPINMRTKCKRIILDAIINFINQKIKEIYNFKIGKGICELQLKNLNKKQKSSQNTLFIKEFIHKTLKEIFSENISDKFSNYLKTHNKNIINKLINEKDKNIRTYFTNLFNLTFLKCLKHFRGEEYFNELKGIYSLKDEIELNKGDDEYIEQLKYYFNNYEKIIKNLRARNRTKK